MALFRPRSRVLAVQGVIPKKYRKKGGPTHLSEPTSWFCEFLGENPITGIMTNENFHTHYELVEEENQ